MSDYEGQVAEGQVAVITRDGSCQEQGTEGTLGRGFVQLNLPLAVSQHKHRFKGEALRAKLLLETKQSAKAKMWSGRLRPQLFRDARFARLVCHLNMSASEDPITKTNRQKSSATPRLAQQKDNSRNAVNS